MNTEHVLVGVQPMFSELDLSLDLLFQGCSQGWGVPIAQKSPRFLVTEHSIMKVRRLRMEAYGCGFSRDFQTSLCIATYGMSMPSVHRESTSSVISYESLTSEYNKPFSKYF